MKSFWFLTIILSWKKTSQNGIYIWLQWQNLKRSKMLSSVIFWNLFHSNTERKWATKILHLVITELPKVCLFSWAPYSMFTRVMSDIFLEKFPSTFVTRTHPNDLCIFFKVRFLLQYASEISFFNRRKVRCMYYVIQPSVLPFK